MEVSELINRVAALENTTQTILVEQRSQATQIIRMDEQVKGVRAQAKEHNSEQAKAVKEMDAKLDKLVAAVGADDSSPSDLRKDFAFVRASRVARESTTEWIRRSVIGLVVMTIATLIVIGAVHYLKKELGLEDTNGKSFIGGSAPGSAPAR